MVQQDLGVGIFYQCVNTGSGNPREQPRPALGSAVVPFLVLPLKGSHGFSLLQEGALDLLKSLTSYTMTIQLLQVRGFGWGDLSWAPWQQHIPKDVSLVCPQSTRIGVAVNSVRKHCSDEEVVASAKILIKNWKRLLGE